MTMKAVIKAVRARAVTRSGETTSVRAAPPMNRLTRTRTGVRARATCRLELRMMLIARSALLASMARTPTTFSTALPAMATTTRPANSSDMPSVLIAGRSA